MKFLWALCVGATALFAADLPVQEGLLLHFDAAQQIPLRNSAKLPPLAQGRAVDRWLDAASGQRVAVQSRAASRPTFFTDKREAFLRFDGVDDFLAVYGARRPARELTVFLLAAPRGNTGPFSGVFATALAGQNDYTTGLNLDQGSKATKELSVLSIESAGSSGSRNLLPPAKDAAAPLPFGNFHVFTVRSAVGARGNELFLDGNRLGTRSRAESEIGLDEIVVGGRLVAKEPWEASSTQGFFLGDIAAMVVYERALTDAQRLEVEQTLFNRTPALNALAAGASQGHALEVLRDPPVVQMLVPGFTVEEMPVSLRNQNNLRYRHDGKLVALGYDGHIHLLSDTDADGREDKATVFWDKTSLRGPIGMELLPAKDPRGEGVLVASKGKVSLILDANRDGVADEEIIVAQGWKEIPQNVDAVGLAVDPRDGSIYFGLGAANYANGYLVDQATGRSAFDLGSERGTIQRVSADFKKRETVCTGVRFTCALAFNEHGDLFAAEQEGATWLPNGNPFDELLHIVAGRHYGFPPRHPKHLPQVIDEPAVFEYAPQHQSTVGMIFNRGVNGGPAFGPASWHGDALLCGESRGKLYRTKLVKTREGYIAQNQIVAALGMLLVDCCVTPDGDLLLACHSGPPDWGTGPAGPGKIFRVRYTGRDLPQPVLAWAAAPDEFRVAFDRPLTPADWTGAREKARIEAGRYVGAGDRYETLRPGYQVVRDQMATPRRWVEIQRLALSADRRTVILRVPRQTEPDNYALTLPTPTAWLAQEGLAQRAEIDLALTLNGVQASLASTEESRRIVLPHASMSVARAFTAGSAEHDDFFRHLDRTQSSTSLTLRSHLGLGNVFVPAIQPGATLDWDISKDSFANRTMTVRQDYSGATPVTLDLSADEISRVAPLQITFEGKLNAGGSGLTFALDDKERPIALNRFSVPWASTIKDTSAENKSLVRTDVHGRWLPGRRVFFGDAGCATCHTIRGEGMALGPDLSNLTHRDRESVLHDITKPSATLNPDQVGTTVKFKDGTQVNGVVRTLNDKKIVIAQPAGVLSDWPRDQVVSMEPMTNSLMPENLGELLSTNQIEDLLTFLLTNPLEPAPITRLDPGLPPARPRQEATRFVSTSGVAAESLTPLRILLSIDSKDHGLNEHDYPLWQKRWSQLLALADKVSVATCHGFPTREQLANADVTVFYSRNAGWSPDAATALDTYQQRGGGLVYLHWAMEGGDHAASLAERIGLATGKSKYRHGEIELVFTQPHPITEGFSTLRFVDETYWAFHGDKARVTPLATAVEDAAVHPQLWTFERQKGRVFGCIPGHYTWTFDDPLYRVLVLRGIAWAAREKDVNRLTELALVGARFAP